MIYKVGITMMTENQNRIFYHRLEKLLQLMTRLDGFDRESLNAELAEI